MKCNSCQKEKPEYYPYSGICEECAREMDDCECRRAGE